MDRLERESKTGKPLLIDLTTQEEEGTSSNNSSVSNGYDTDDSDYKAGDDCTKQGQKKKARRKKIETQDKGDIPRNEKDNLTMLSKACGDMIEGNSEYHGEEIIVNEDNCGDNDNFLDNLLDADEDQMNREQEEDQESGDASNKNDKQDNISINQDSADGVKTGKKKKKEKKKSPDEEEVNSKELSDNKITGQSLQGTREDDQVDQVDQERQETTQHDSPKELTKSQRKRLRKKEKKAEKRKREQSEDQESEVSTNRFDKEDDTSMKGDSADGVEERRKKKKKRRSSH
jgi:hypothetical protein